MDSPAARSFTWTIPNTGCTSRRVLAEATASSVIAGEVGEALQCIARFIFELEARLRALPAGCRSRRARAQGERRRSVKIAVGDQTQSEEEAVEEDKRRGRARVGRRKRVVGKLARGAKTGGRLPHNGHRALLLPLPAPAPPPSSPFPSSTPPQDPPRASPSLCWLVWSHSTILVSDTTRSCSRPVP